MDRKGFAASLGVSVLLAVAVFQVIDAQRSPAGPAATAAPHAGSVALAPFDRQVKDNIAKMAAASPSIRAAGANALGFLRAYSAADALSNALRDAAAASVKDIFTTFDPENMHGRHQSLSPQELDDLVQYVLSQ